jgi:amidase
MDHVDHRTIEPPATAAGPVYGTATDIASAIRRKEVSALEVVEAHLRQIDRHNSRVNAVVTLDVDGARAGAQAADKALAQGEVWGPLHGVPMTIKDWFATAGLRSTFGLPEYAEHVPATDATAVRRLREAGAIIIGKTNVPGLGGGFFTDNPVFGRTNNPWNLERTPGGSSGGAAAALAAGMVPLELGTDVGGSVRIPAHYCGVFSLKTTARRVPTDGYFVGFSPTPSAVQHLNVVGPLARSVEDLELALRIIAGPVSGQWDVPPVPLEARPDASRPLPRLAWTDSLGVPVSADTRRALAALASKLASLGYPIEQAAPADFDADALCDVWGTIAPVEFGTLPPPEALDAVGGEAPDEPVLRGMQRVATGGLPVYLAGLTERERYIGVLEEFLSRWDALLCPVSVGPAIPHVPPGTPIVVDDRTERYWTAGVAFTVPFNLTGNPAVTLPLARSSDGLPIGMQVIGLRWGEIPLLAIARQLAEVIGPFQRPPGY